MSGEIHIGDRLIEVVSGSIADLEGVDALVSPDDERLSHSGGASGALWGVGGPRMALAVEGSAPKLSLGQVWASPAGALSARLVLHAVTVSWSKSKGVGLDAESIGPLFRRVLEEAERWGCESVGLPMLGTGAGGLSREVCVQALSDAHARGIVHQGSQALQPLVQIKPGNFLMGSPEGEVGRGEDETQHRVTHTRDFLIQVTPVTQSQWEEVMGTNPSGFRGPDRPVDNVHWYDAVAYCNALSRREGLTETCHLKNPRGTPGRDLRCDGVISLGDTDGYRLPTEAEAERAARAGEMGAAPGALDTVAWIGQNSGDVSQPVGLKAPNAWGLYDVLGNVWEWVWDWYHSHTRTPVVDPSGPERGAYKIARGGSWRSVAWAARLANRTRHGPDHYYKDTGFRVVRTLGWVAGNAFSFLDEGER